MAGLSQSDIVAVVGAGAMGAGIAQVAATAGHKVFLFDAKPGAAGTEVWTFDAIKPGSATLTTSYGQPWPGGTKGAWTFSAAVSVR